jgi:hypothetical protein
MLFAAIVSERFNSICRSTKSQVEYPGNVEQ